jgi:hypothetical protein
VKNLWRNIGAYSTSLGAYLFSGGKQAAGRIDTGEPITGRDLIALLATIGIDLGLLALAILNPPQEPPSIRPSNALSRQIRDAIDTAIARSGVDHEWVHRHFVHHNKASYLVIPNLYSCDASNKDESAKGLAMNQLSGVLSDLGLVTWPDKGVKWGRLRLTKSELQRLREDEMVASDTDLTEVHKKWEEEKGRDPAKSVKPHSDRPIRNHGLFSKAERALEMADWSEGARRDVEIFRLVETDGLTPLLMVLNEARPAGGDPVAPPKQAHSAA